MAITGCSPVVMAVLTWLLSVSRRSDTILLWILPVLCVLCVYEADIMKVLTAQAREDSFGHILGDMHATHEAWTSEWQVEKMIALSFNPTGELIVSLCE